MPRGQDSLDALSDLYPLLEAIVSFMDDGVVIADERGEVLYQNPAAGELLGSGPNEPVARLGQIPARKLAAALEAAGSASGGNFARFEERMEGEDGERTLEFHTGLIDVPSGHRLRLLITTDRTAQRRMEAVFDRARNELVTNDPRMMDILHRVQQVAPTSASVLLQGESGTGKTQIARMIHDASHRPQGPFVEVNCAAIPETLIESELFGHVKGAFTGAHQDRPGRFLAANGGTLLLDEVGEIPLHLQAKLLRAVQDQIFEPVGSDKTIEVDVRVISATNRPLRDMVDEGSFRGDLYYRLAVIPIPIPPLRQRPGDIPTLLNFFCKGLVARGYPDDVECTPEAMRLLMDYPWPGNVRELENAVEHGIICAVDKRVYPESLPQDIREHRLRKPVETVDIDVPSPAADERGERRAEIQAALESSGGNKAEAAKILGIERTTLWRRMKALGMS